MSRSRVNPISLLWIAVCCTWAAAASAQPANDAIANAEVITTLPFSDTETAIHLATTELADPIVPCRIPRTQAAHSVWYRYTTGATVEYINLTTATSDYDTMIVVHAGPPDDLRPIAGGCNDQGIAGSSTLARLSGVRLMPSTTYHIEVVQKTTSATPRTLNLTVSAAPRYTVTKLFDTNDGVCAPSDCSLREAFQAANTSPGAVLIPAGTYSISIAGTGEEQNQTGDFDVATGIGIYGAGRAATIIDGGDIDRLVDINPQGASGMTVHVADMTIANGFGSSFANGGGLRASGEAVTLYLTDSTFRENASQTQGGAVATSALTFVDGCDFRANANSAFGGGIYFSSTLPAEVRNSLFAANNGGNGGAIASAGDLTIVNSTLTGNSAGANGGGIHFHGTGTLRLFSTTIANNSSPNTSGGGGIFLQSGSLPAQFFNSVIVGNTAVSNGFDCNFNTASGTYNHVSANECFSGGTGNVRNTPITLLPLTNLGGRQDVRTFDASSPLLDSANPGGCFDDTGRNLLNDQRGPGFSRLLDGNNDGATVCDKGAFEFTPPSPLIFANGFE